MKARNYAAILAITVILATGISFIHSHQASGTESNYNLLVDSFFEKMDSGAYGDAIDFIYSNNPWMANKTDDIRQLKTQFRGLSDVTGKYLGHKFLLSEEMTDRFVFINHIVYMERQPIRFYFSFYKVGDNWTTYSFGYTDDIEEWIEEKAKTNFIYSIS